MLQYTLDLRGVVGHCQRVIHSWHSTVTYPLKSNNYTVTKRRRVHQYSMQIKKQSTQCCNHPLSTLHAHTHTSRPPNSHEFFEKMLSKAQDIYVQLPSIHSIKDALQKAVTWSRQAQAMQVGEHLEYILMVLFTLVTGGRPPLSCLDPLSGYCTDADNPCLKVECCVATVPLE